MGSAVSAISSATSSIGSAIGGTVGGLVGGISQGITPEARLADSARINAAIDAIKQQRDALTAQVQTQQANFNQAQTENQNAIGILQGAASGNAPSQARGVLQQGLDQAIAAQYALSQSGNVSTLPSALKEAQNNIASQTQQTANQAGMLRAQEMATNRQNLASATGQNLGTNANFLNALNSQVGTTEQQQAGIASGSYAADTGAQNAANQALQKNAQTLIGGGASAAGQSGLSGAAPV